MDLRGRTCFRPQRPWRSSARPLLVVLAAVLWPSGERAAGEVERLRSELKVLSSEAEALRTLAAPRNRRVTILEKQVQGIRTERDEANTRSIERMVPKTPAKAPSKSGKSTSTR